MKPGTEAAISSQLTTFFSSAPRPGTVQISAQAPLSELEHFPARLKSLTAGHGSYSLEFSHYEAAPPQLQQKLAAAHKPHAEVE